MAHTSISSLSSSPKLSLLSMISVDALEAAVRTAIPVAHLEIIDQSNGCGENYAVLVVSEVCASGLHFWYESD